MFTNVSYGKCQNISISHVFSNTMRNAGFFIGKKSYSEICTFIFPIETTGHFYVFLFFIQWWNINISNIFLFMMGKAPLPFPPSFVPILQMEESH